MRDHYRSLSSRLISNLSLEHLTKSNHGSYASLATQVSMPGMGSGFCSNPWHRPDWQSAAGHRPVTDLTLRLKTRRATRNLIR